MAQSGGPSHRPRGLEKFFWQSSDRYFQLPRTYAEEPTPRHEHPLGAVASEIGRWWIRLSSGDRHPTARFYVGVGIILTVLTALEVWAFNWGIRQSAVVPLLLALSAVKFALVVGFFMHLRFEHPILRQVFSFGLVLAIAIGLSL
ncbi:MAG: cytochrome C oxidase subunit IV family protein, partial [Chloroflexi bacterium]|nr:cytochrome C oxidase subunit IV family protein [Chloroflexota bacterium]